MKVKDSKKNFIDDFKNKKILVVGDLILDLYIRGVVERISPEAPVPVVLEKSKKYVLGGAGNVAANASALKGNVTLVGICGNDQEGRIMKKICRSLQIVPRFLIEKGRPTSLKTRATADRHQVLRIDREAMNALRHETEQKLISLVKKLGAYDIVVLSDYAKGCITPRVADFVRNYFGGKKIIVGVKPSQAMLYKNVFAVVLNLKEAMAITGARVDSDAAAVEIMKRLKKN